MSSAQWLHIHYIMLGKGVALLGGKNHGDAEQVESSSTSLCCVHMQSEGEQDTRGVRRAAWGTAHRAEVPTLLTGRTDVPTISEEGAGLPMASSLAHCSLHSLPGPPQPTHAFKDHPSIADSRLYSLNLNSKLKNSLPT